MLVGLTLASVIAHAAVIDDFNGASPGWPGANPPKAASDPPAVFELADQRLRMAASFTTATSPASPFDHFMNIYYSTNLPVDEGRTLELRADLVSASHDNLFAFLGTMNASGGEYFVVKDRNEIGLLKWSQNDGFSLAFWTNRVIKNQGVVLKLTLTPISKGLVIGTKVLDKGTGAVLFKREALDTPASDWGVPDPLPHGWQIFNPDPGQPYAEDLTLVWAGMLHDTDGQQGLAEMRLDNLEYDTYSSAYLEIGGGAALLTWPEDTAEEQIVVGADSVPSTAWLPLPEPIYKRFGQFCMALPTTNAQQFGKLVPGTQFIDDFGEPAHPFATRNPWRFNPAVAAPMAELWPADGVLRVEWPTPSSQMCMAFPPEPEVGVGDSYSSIDILEWEAPASSYFALTPRLLGGPPPSLVYGGGVMLALNHPSAGKVSLFTTYAGDTRYGPSFEMDKYPLPYRLECLIVGTSYTGRVIHLPTQKQIANFTQTYQQPTWGSFVGFLFEAAVGEGVGPHRITLDNFFLTGTKP